MNVIRNRSGRRPGRRLALAALLLGGGMGLAGCGGGAEAIPGTAAEGGGGPGLAAAPPPLPTPAAPTTIVGDRMGGMGSSAMPVAANPTVPQEPSPFRFEEVAKAAGIDFVHFSGMTAEKHFPTANGSGAAVFDADGDGRMDVYFATCMLLTPGAKPSGPNRLYRNRGDGTFEDVTERSGLGFAGFCHGIVVGDVDNDGDPDVYLCNYGPNTLFLNNGDGTFADISEGSGADEDAWSSGGSFLDYDNDGDLDLYVSHYGRWSYERDAGIFCGEQDPAHPVRLYCSPRSIETVRHTLFRNNGDRTFTDVSETAGITRSDGHGFGVVAADLNGDGLVDLYVANDMNPNFLYLNNGDGTFTDATETSGAAFDERGQAQSGMGVDAEDVIDGDGRPELFVTNFQNEYNTLYQNLGNGAFMDSTQFVGLGADSLPWVGWGAALADFDNDGWPDAFVANGHVDDNRRQLHPPQPVDHEEPPLLHRNVDGRRFKLATRDVGPYFASKHVARGAAFGDLDDDGRLDIVVSHKDAAPAVLLNRTPSALENRWIRLRLVGTKSNRDAIGARVEVQAGDRTLYRQRKGNYSMMSAHDPRLLIGLGDSAEAARVTVRWPSGVVSVHEDLKAGQTHELAEPKDAP